MPSIVVPIADFRARYPEFSAFADARAEVFLEDAEADTSSTVFGDTHARAISALAAHRMILMGDGTGGPSLDQGGALASASVDGVSAAYQVPAGLSTEDSALWATVYGQLFLELRKRVAAGMYVVC